MDRDLILNDMRQANTDALLIKNAYNEEKWEEFETSSYAFFPGCQLSGCEPELVIKAYDSIRFQHPDTGVFFCCCGKPADALAAREEAEKAIDDIRKGWEKLGKPRLILACTSCMKFIEEHAPEIPVVSFYAFLIDSAISGGCNSTDYNIVIPEESEKGVYNEVTALAEDMGVKLHPVAIDSDSLFEYPILTYSIQERDKYKYAGHDSVHILELIYGMSDSNSHLEHKHEHDLGHAHEMYDESCENTECDGDCNSCKGGCSDEPKAPTPLPTSDERLNNRLELKQLMLDLFWS